MHGLLLKCLLLTTVYRYSVAPVSSLVCFHPKENSFIPRLPPITLCDPNTGEEPGNEVARLLTTIYLICDSLHAVQGKIHTDGLIPS